MRKGKIRFPLKLKDDAEVCSLEELRENFDPEKIIKYFSDGSLERWLDVWMLTDEAEKVRALDKDDKAIGRKLCEIFGVKPPEEAVDAEDIAWRTEREARLKQHTGDKEILANVDFVAFDSGDLYDILEEEDTDTIYLCNNSFNFNSGVLRYKNKRYIGIGKAEAVIGSKEPVDFDSLGITFKNVQFDEEYRAITQSSFGQILNNSSIEFLARINDVILINKEELRDNLIFQFEEYNVSGIIQYVYELSDGIKIKVRLNKVFPLQKGDKFKLILGPTKITTGRIVSLYSDT